MKGFTKDGKFHPITDYKKGTRKSRDTNATSQGVKIERKARVIEDEFPLDTIMTKMEKDFEIGLKEHDFTNPKLRNKQWSVGISYEGGFSEEYFGFWAQPVDESIEPVKISEWISNDGWSDTGDFEEDEKFQKKLERNPDFAEREYAKWLASSFEQYDDHWFMQLADAIEDENE